MHIHIHTDRHTEKKQTDIFTHTYKYTHTFIYKVSFSVHFYFLNDVPHILLIKLVEYVIK